MLANYFENNLYTVIGTGIVIIILFVILSIFKTIFSASFIGMVLALYAYFISEYYYEKIPVLSCLGLLLCLIGITKSELLKRVFSVIGIIIAGLNLLTIFNII